MFKGGKLDANIFIGILGAAMIVWSIFRGSSIEQNDTKQVLEGVNKLGASIKSVVEQEVKIKQDFDALSERVTEIKVNGLTNLDGQMKQTGEVLHNYIEKVDKKVSLLDEQVKSLQHRARDKGPIAVKLEQPVEIIYYKKDPPKIEGAGKLLKKAGVSQ